jgi:hypothetical protein
MGSYNDKQAKSRATKVKAAKAMELRAAGLGWQEVAEKVGYKDGASAYNLVARETERMTVEGAKQLRLTQLDRLHALLSTEWDTAINRDAPDHYKAVDRTLKVLGQITDLFGLDALGYEEDQANEGWPNNTVVIGLTREEYFDALGKAHAKRRAEDDARLALQSTQPLLVDMFDDDEEAVDISEVVF